MKSKRFCWKMPCRHRIRTYSVLIFAIIAGSSLVLLLPELLSWWKTPTEQNIGENSEHRLSKQDKAMSPDTRATKHSSSDLTCVPPKLDPYAAEVMQYHQKMPPVNCTSAMKDWVHVTNGTFRISRESIELYGEIVCDYAPIVRDGDYAIRYGPHVKPMLDGTPLRSDFFKVACESAGGKRYTNVHAAVVSNAAVMERLHKHHCLGKYQNAMITPSEVRSPASGSLSLSASCTPHNAHVSRSFRSLNISVFMFGFDSLSRMAWLRLLPKTRRYLVDTLGGIELEGHNILGEGTISALLPILTGRKSEELPEARRGFKGAEQIDNFPWVWKEFSDHGYVTAFSEDRQTKGTFQRRLRGFRNQPTDHYTRPFYLSAEETYEDNLPLCLGSTPRHVVLMNWFRNLFDEYRNFPKFFFGFHAENSHDNNNRVQSLDDDLVTFLQELEAKGHLNSTLLILMADHGVSFEDVRATSQGRLEGRMPYFSFRFPPWFEKLYPGIVKNMKTNSKRLTTPFDIHATFLDVLNHSFTHNGDLGTRAISLFKEIPKERTCSHAEVSSHWCACLEWQPVNQSDSLVVQAVELAVQEINSYTQSRASECAELALLEITGSYRYVPDSNNRSVGAQALKHRHAPPTAELYQVSFKTFPGPGHFEATCSLDVKSRTFSVDAPTITRINSYEMQSFCISPSQHILITFCYCIS